MRKNIPGLMAGIGVVRKRFGGLFVMCIGTEEGV